MSCTGRQVFTTSATWEALNDLNQTPYDFRVDVPNGLEGLDLVARVPELWTEVRNTVQDAAAKTIPKKNKGNEQQWLSEEALQRLRKEGSGTPVRKGKI